MKKFIISYWIIIMILSNFLIFFSSLKLIINYAEILKKLIINFKNFFKWNTLVNRYFRVTSWLYNIQKGEIHYKYRCFFDFNNIFILLIVFLF